MRNEPLEGFKIMFVIPHSPEAVGYSSGFEFLSLAAYHDYYCRSVSDLGADVELVYFNNKDHSPQPDEYRVRTVPVVMGSSYGYEISLQLLYLTIKSDVDLFHIHGYNQPNALPILGILALNQAPVVVHNHGSALNPLKFKHRLWYRAISVLANRIDGIISVNKDELQNLERAGISSSKLFHVPNGVDSSIFYPMDKVISRRSLGLNQYTRYLLFVGRLSPEKGVKYLITALSHLPENVELLLVYGGADVDEERLIRERIRKHDLRNRVHFVGEVDHDILPLYYNAADVGVFPSINEGFGIVTLEAMACATPVVGTTEHAAGGHLIDGENAMIAEPASSENLSSVIETLLQNPNIRVRIADAGFQTVQNQYTWEHVGEKLVDIYTDVS